MAAFDLAYRAGIMQEIGVVVALGNGYRPIADELAQLVGRKVIVIGDRDNAGIESVRRVSAALCSHGVDHVVLNWNAFPNFAGKDLFDLIQFGNGEKPSWYLELFSFFPPSYCTSSVFSRIFRLLCSFQMFLHSSARPLDKGIENCSSWREQPSKLKMLAKRNLAARSYCRSSRLGTLRQPRSFAWTATNASSIFCASATR